MNQTLYEAGRQHGFYCGHEALDFSQNTVAKEASLKTAIRQSLGLSTLDFDLDAYMQNPAYDDLFQGFAVGYAQGLDIAFRNRLTARNHVVPANIEAIVPYALEGIKAASYDACQENFPFTSSPFLYPQQLEVPEPGIEKAVGITKARYVERYQYGYCGAVAHSLQRYGLGHYFEAPGQTPRIDTVGMTVLRDMVFHGEYNRVHAQQYPNYKEAFTTIGNHLYLHGNDNAVYGANSVADEAKLFLIINAARENLGLPLRWLDAPQKRYTPDEAFLKKLQDIFTSGTMRTSAAN